MVLKHKTFVGKPQTVAKFQELCTTAFLLKTLRNSLIFSIKTYFFITFVRAGYMKKMTVGSC